MDENEDIKIFRSIKGEIDRLLHELQKPEPIFKPRDLPGELHGFLADLAFQDKVRNQTLVGFITGLVALRDRNNDETLQLLRDLSRLSGEMVISLGEYYKARKEHPELYEGGEKPRGL